MSGLIFGLLGAAIGVAGGVFGTIVGTRAMLAQAESDHEVCLIKRKTVLTTVLTVLWLIPTLILSLVDIGLSQWVIEFGIWGSFLILLAVDGCLWKDQIAKPWFRNR